MAKSKIITTTAALEADIQSLIADVIGLPAKTVLEARAQEIRELIFEAQAIVDVTAAASESDVRTRAHGIRSALDVVFNLLDKAAEKLEPSMFVQPEVSHHV
jgi:hypothetical protein